MLLALALLSCTSSDPVDDTGATGGTTSDGGTALTDPWAGHALLEDGRFYVTAHRGGALLRPEHTMEAYAHAWGLGTDILELDVHATSDGVMVVMHDDTVDRTTDGTGTIKDMTWKELSALDAGYWFTSDGGETYPYRGTGLAVPTVEEVLAAYPDALFNIELKQSDPPLVEPMLAMLDSYDARSRTAMTSFEDDVLWSVREADPSMLTCLGALEAIELVYWDEDDIASYQAPAPFFAAPVEYAGIVMTAELVAKAQAAGVRVHAWTVNEPAQMTEVLGFGVDGIITDDPATLIDLVAR